MIRSILAAIAGLVAWIVVGQLGDMLIRVLLPRYAAAEPAMAFTLPMMISRLILGALSSVAAGYLCSVLARGRREAVFGLAAVLLAGFVYMHIGLWPRFPVWYHAFFLLTLVPFVLLGARAARRGAPV
jgi:hypothetical protein